MKSAFTSGIGGANTGSHSQNTLTLVILPKDKAAIADLLIISTGVLLHNPAALRTSKSATGSEPLTSKTVSLSSKQPS